MTSPDIEPRHNIKEDSIYQMELNLIREIEDLEKVGIHAHSLLATETDIKDIPLLQSIDTQLHLDLKPTEETKLP